MRTSTSALLLIGVVAAACNQPSTSLRGQVIVFGEEDHSNVEIIVAGPITQRSVTDADGRWQMSRVPPGHYAITASAPDTRESVSTTVEVDSELTVDAPKLTLTATGSITGRVIGEDGVPPASIVIVGVGGNAASSDGQFVVSSIPTGPRDVIIDAPGHQQVRRKNVIIRRGESVSLNDIEMIKLEDGTTAPVGVLTGFARVPGATDQSGIRVDIEGTTRTTTTTADGRFSFDAVPGGIVALSFHRGEYWANVPRVLVIPSSTGFIVDGALYDLARQVVPLRVGLRLSASLALWNIVDGERTAIATSTAVTLIDSQGNRRTFPDQPLQHPPIGYYDGGFWYISRFGPNGGAVKRIDLTTSEMVTFYETLSLNNSILPFAGGVAWADYNGLWIKSSPSAPERRVIDGTEIRWYRLADDSLIVFRSDKLFRVGPDGSLLYAIPLAQNYRYLTLAPDQRHVVLSSELSYQLPLLVFDTYSRSQFTIPSCSYPSFSPDSSLLVCGDSVFNVSTGTGRPIGRGNDQSIFWASNSAFIIRSTAREARIVREGLPDLAIDRLYSLGEPYIRRMPGVKVRMAAHYDAATRLGDVVEIDLTTGEERVLVTEAKLETLALLNRGVVFTRPRSIGADLDLWYADDHRGASLVGHTISDSNWVTGRDDHFTSLVFEPMRPPEALVVDTRNGRSYTVGGFDWVTILPRRKALVVSHSSAPFYEMAGSFLVDLP